MESNYKDFLEENKEILEYIKNNDLVDLIDEADSTAKKYADLEGPQFLHSYRYSQVYDILTCDGYEKGRKAIAITKLLENSYDKKIDELVNDSFDNSMEMV